jgi:hypothetical protein
MEHIERILRELRSYPEARFWGVLAVVVIIVAIVVFGSR